VKKPNVKIIKQALFDNNGILVNTAQQIGCSRQALKKWIDDTPELIEAHKEAKEIMLDRVEHQLMKNVLEGRETSIIWYLKCQGKSRGWVNPEIEGIANATFNQLNINVQSESAKLTIEETIKKLSGE
jgi:hypothetical protein